MSKLLAAAILSSELDSENTIHAALFSAAFSELDDLRKALEQIPKNIDQSAIGFNKVTTQAVDDFVHVANEALSKFMQRTKEIIIILDKMEQQLGRQIGPQVSDAALAPPTPSAPSDDKNSNMTKAPWWAFPVVGFVGVAIGAVVAYFLMR